MGLYDIPGYEKEFIKNLTNECAKETFEWTIEKTIYQVHAFYFQMLSDFSSINKYSFQNS